MLAVALAVHAGAAGAQSPTPQAPAVTDLQVIPLWEGRAPGALGDAPADRPQITVYLPRASNSTAVIVAPGGGYQNLAMNHEGRQVAGWLNAMGVTAFVLQYRLGPRYRHPIELGDAQRAIRLVRSRAAEFRISPDRIGILGFSAGGHLASTAATHFDAGNPSAPDAIDRPSSRPDFLVLGYPVITMDPAFTHAGSRRNLLGDNPDPRLQEELSNELRVTAQTPPTFLFHTTNDAGVPVMNSVVFYQALVKAGVPAEMHLFANGPHGVGLALNDPALSQWPNLLANWMRARGLLQAPAAPAPAPAPVPGQAPRD
ncbi:MAG: alpha/beta hydrolase [Gemmatimonadetes bacterium]|nr:alpha/beta hydrolase [Gemmatimonadota bacterium]